MRNLLVLVFLVFSSTQAFCNDPYREFMACVDELLDTNRGMDPKTAEDICSDLLDNIKDPSYQKEAKKPKDGPASVSRKGHELSLDSILSLVNDIEVEISDSHYQVVLLTTTAATSYSLWWMIRNNPVTLFKLIAKRITPVLVILPPGTLDFAFNPNKDKIILPGTEEQQKHLMDLLELEDHEKLQVLKNDDEFRDYLFQLESSIQTQKFLLRHKNRPVI